MANGLSSIDKVASWISVGELVILLFMSPLFLFIRPSWALVLGLLPLLWLVRRRATGHFIPRTPVDWSILGLLTMVLASIWATPDFAFSLGKIVGVLYGVAIFYAITQMGQHRQSMLPVATIAVILGTAAAFLSLLSTQWVTKWSFVRAITIYLPEALMSVPGYESGFNANQVSGALIMFPPLQLAMLSGLFPAADLPRTRRRWLILGLCLSLVLVGVVILLAQSRAAWAALAFGLVCMGAIAMKPLRPVLLVLIIAGVIALLVLSPVGVTEWLVQEEWMVGSGEVSWQARLELWSRGLWAIADFPLTGTGMNMFRRTIWNYPVFHFPYGKDIGHSHQTYLQVALDLGLPGLISYLALLGGTFYAGWRSYKKSPARLTQLITLGGLTGLAVHAVWGLTDAVALGAKQGFLWWAMMALVVAAVVVEKQKESQPTNVNPHRPAQIHSSTLDQPVIQEPGT